MATLVPCRTARVPSKQDSRLLRQPSCYSPKAGRWSGPRRRHPRGHGVALPASLSPRCERPGTGPRRALLRTTSERAGPASADACLPLAKEACAHDLRRFPSPVLSGRALDASADARIRPGAVLLDALAWEPASRPKPAMLAVNLVLRAMRVEQDLARSDSRRRRSLGWVSVFRNVSPRGSGRWGGQVFGSLLSSPRIVVSPAGDGTCRCGCMRAARSVAAAARTRAPPAPARDVAARRS